MQNLESLIFENADARQYYNELPDYVREQIRSRGDSVKSFENLKDYAENLLRGDD